jgi:tetratricopeptide (TPR) repeat protein
MTWFYVPLFAVISFYYFFAKRDNEIRLAGHNLYFCYTGFLIAVLSITAFFQSKKNIKKYLIWISLGFLVFYTGLTISENLIWQNEVQLFEKNVKYNKNSVFNFLAYANLGLAYERAGKLRQAEESFKLAAERSRGDPDFYNLLAGFYIRNGDVDKALKNLVISEKLDGNFSETYFWLGISYAKKGEKVKARYNFEKALLLNPGDLLSKKYLEALEDM